MNSRKIRAIIIGGALVLFFIVLLSFFADQRDQLHLEVENLRRGLKQQKEKTESLQAINAQLMLDHNLRRLDQALEASPDRSLSASTIRWVINLSEGLAPYEMLSGDTMDSVLHSPERGQLLQYLLALNLEDSTWRFICTHADFSYADLKGVDLSGANLSGINLKGALMSDANIEGATLDGSQLTNAIAYHANFDDASLVKADMAYAEMSWASLHNTSLDSANLFGAQLKNSDLRNASLKGAMLKWSNLSGALLSSANLNTANLHGSTLRLANLSHADARYAKLSKTDLTKAVLDSANFEGVVLENASVLALNWLDQANSAGVQGLKNLGNSYEVVVDITKRSSHRLQLRKSSAE